LPVSFNIFEEIKTYPPRVRAVDMQPILRLLLFHLDGLLADVVLEYNQEYPLIPVFDPSSELIGITIAFIEWYNLYRRRYPPKDEVDIKTFGTLGEKKVQTAHISYFSTYNTYFAYLIYEIFCIC
jgi:hypothetical protein